eukprot:CAMPEP_0114498978 /NCGR_PEP_ID=MMETSP0109-20121206/7165_1 /TAXON_ID=29199 /ORGANISM="Chlorarachnion reptans, Strain CCCM449" /LENGTH=2132 /DNA_ID=CAMNT_0001676501 /DNA_START=186 /DNA_END=6581 /DNA_ORIENTATION=+
MQSLSALLRQNLTPNGQMDIEWERMRRQETLKRRRAASGEKSAESSKESRPMTWARFTEGAEGPAKREIRQTFLGFLGIVRELLGEENANPESAASGARVLFKTLTLRASNANSDKYKKDIIRKYLGRISNPKFAEATRLARELKAWQRDNTGGMASASSGVPDAKSVEAVRPPEPEFEVLRRKYLIPFRERKKKKGSDGNSDGDDVVLLGKEEKGTTAKGSSVDVDKSAKAGFDYEWLLRECEKYATFTEYGDPIITEGQLADSALATLRSKASSDEIQNQLLELFGYESFDLIAKLITNRTVIVARAIKGKKKSKFQIERNPVVATHGQGYFSQVSIQTTEEKRRNRINKKKLKRAQREAAKAGVSLDYGPKAQLEKRQEAKRKELQDIRTGLRSQEGTVFGLAKLPKGSKVTNNKGITEVYIPPKTQDPEKEIKRVDVKTLPKYAQVALKGIESLNQVQSRCFETAFTTNENMLVCAPTGAGKTNVALLTILHEIGQHLIDGVLQKDAFKIVFVAPMKALAQEVVRKFTKRLGPLGLEIKELTGDMQLTKREIQETQILVTTPEKWDVITRKSTEASLMQQVKLLLFDEVHLLHEDRGPVIEILVARTLRKVESSQEMCRIVGISATLPNYADVAVFLRVNPIRGLFYFGNEFRPVPLHQTYVGVTDPNAMRRKTKMNEIAFEKMEKSLKENDQVMVFVHSRKETQNLAEEFLELFTKNDSIYLIDPDSTVKGYDQMLKKVNRSRNDSLKKLWRMGLGFHHAGMHRSDRGIIEESFARGYIKVITCTATLAWGVNLPAHTVIIKGTTLYIPDKGGFCQLGMLDVMQIFGRAGRPQFDQTGEAFLITEHDQLQRYLALLNHAMPIESQFIKALPDHLNAEIILGTVSNLKEAIEWLGYTYLYIRMLRNPMVYGVSYKEREMDELLVSHRRRLIKGAAQSLEESRMVSFDEKSGNFFSTDNGRVASHFYIHHESVLTYNEMLKPYLTDEQILVVLAHSREFSNIKIRDEEIRDVEKLARRCCPMKIKGGLNDDKAKVNVLLQAFISNFHITSPTLGSDSYYISQSAGRICRALFQMVLKRGLPYLSGRLLMFCKMIERRVWNHQHPLRQFPIHHNLVTKLEERNITLDHMLEMDEDELGAVVRQSRSGRMLKKYFSTLPYLDVKASLQPITRNVLRVSLLMKADFRWANQFHGQSEGFWIWMEDPENDVIYHSEYFMLGRRNYQEDINLSFTIPISEPLPPQYFIRVISDRWLGSETTVPVSFQGLILPTQYPPDTKLLVVDPLPVTALFNPRAEKLYRFSHFNPIQTQMFHIGYHTDHNILLGAPTGSGKTIASEICIHRLFREYPGKKVIYIAPLKALARERLVAWSREKSFGGIGRTTVELTGDATPDARSLKKADIVVTTPEKWDGVSRSWESRGYVKQVGLVVIDEIHMLGQDRGPVLEVIVSRMRYISSKTGFNIRIVGLSTALANASDLADWLGIDGPGLFNFPPKVRPIPLTVHISGYPGKHYCPRMALMNKPTYAAIRTYSPSKPVLVFVSSRRQTRLTAIDLAAFCAADGDPHKFVHLDQEELDAAISRVRDSNLKHMLNFGIGLHHAGMVSGDRKVVEELFVEQKIQVLVATSTLAWGVNFPAHLVVVKGTEFFDPKAGRYVDMPITDVLQMMGRAGRPQFDTSGTACVLVQDSKKNFYHKFLHSPFPVESSLLDKLHNYINAEIVGGAIKSLNDAIDYLTWTFLFRRLLVNPSYYGVKDASPQAVNAFMLDLLTTVLGDLEEAGCIQLGNDEDPESTRMEVVQPLTLGYISSYYYLDYTSVAMFQESLTESSDLSEILTVLSDATEYDELPVRHNEDKINEQLASKVRFPVREDYEDPHVKANLLFQCHLARLALPMSDFITDTRSLLDQAIRILQAMIDISAENGYLKTTLNIMHLTQLIVQGTWDTKSDILTIPKCTDKFVEECKNNSKVQINSLSDLVQLPRKSQEHLMRRSGMKKPIMDSVFKTLGKIPDVEVKYKLPDGGMEEDPVPADSTLSLAIRLKRSRPLKGGVAMHKCGKSKTEGWWIVIGRVDNDELLALKRVMCHNTTTVNLEIEAPEEKGAYEHVIYLVSDSYRGVDRQRNFTLHVSDPDPSPKPS